jgi:hypothetical protein
MECPHQTSEPTENFVGLQPADDDAGVDSPEAGLGVAENPEYRQSVIRLAQALVARTSSPEFTPEAYTEEPTHPTGWPKLTDYLPNGATKIPRVEAARMRRYAVLAVISSGVVEHAVDWDSIDPEAPRQTILLNHFLDNPVTGTTDPFTRFDDKSSPLNRFMDQANEQFRQAGNLWYHKKPELVDDLGFYYDDPLLPADKTSGLTRFEIDGDRALRTSGEGAFEVWGVLDMLGKLRETNGLAASLDRTEFLRAAHDIADDWAIQKRARYTLDMLHVTHGYLEEGRRERVNLGRLALSVTEGPDGTKYQLNDDKQNSPRPLRIKTASKLREMEKQGVSPRLMCPLFLLNPDDPAPAFGRMEPRRTGFRSYLGAAMHAMVNTAAERCDYLLPADLR